MDVTDEMMHSIIPNSTVARLLCAVKNGATQCNGGLNCGELRNVLRVLKPSEYLASDVRAVVVSKLTRVLKLPANPATVFTATRKEYQPSPEEIKAFFSSMAEVVYGNYPIAAYRSKHSLNFSSSIGTHIGKLYSELLDSLNWASSIYVRMDENYMGLIQFMISGPSDTPYDNGLFLFELDIPEQYPMIPPQVKFLTTGNGRYRANPNLYSNGKVCLSILGTWKGPSWDPKLHHLASIILAIQSQVLNEYPLRNEPAYELVSPENIKVYNAIIRLHTLRWGMIEMIEHPPLGFENVCKQFFQGVKKEEIKYQMMLWKDEAEKLIITEYERSALLFATADTFINGHIDLDQCKATIVQLTTQFTEDVLRLLD